jgi:hypothetical protein
MCKQLAKSLTPQRTTAGTLAGRSGRLDLLSRRRHLSRMSREFARSMDKVTNTVSNSPSQKCVPQISPSRRSVALPFISWPPFIIDAA